MDGWKYNLYYSMFASCVPVFNDEIFTGQSVQACKQDMDKYHNYDEHLY